MTVTTLEAGQHLVEVRRQAKLEAPAGGWEEGSVHDDAYARTALELRGGLVPGVSLVAYVEEALGAFSDPRGWRAAPLM